MLAYNSSTAALVCCILCILSVTQLAKRPTTCKLSIKPMQAPTPFLQLPSAHQISTGGTNPVKKHPATHPASQPRSWPKIWSSSLLPSSSAQHLHKAPRNSHLRI
jgi:hypothetical protein